MNHYRNWRGMGVLAGLIVAGWLLYEAGLAVWGWMQ
jgi:hypothetical protein